MTNTHKCWRTPEVSKKNFAGKPAVKGIPASDNSATVSIAAINGLLQNNPL